MNQPFDFQPRPAHPFSRAQVISIILRNVRRQKPATRALWANSKNDSESRTQAKRILIRQWVEEASTNPAIIAHYKQVA